MSTFPLGGFYGGSQPEPRPPSQPRYITSGARRMSDLLLPDAPSGGGSSLAEMPEPAPATSPLYERQPEGYLLSQVGADLGPPVVDQTAGLRANAPNLRSAFSLEDLSLASMEAEKRFRQLQHDRDAPLYQGIAEQEARQRDPVEDEIESRKKMLTRDRLRPVAPQTLNDMGLSEEITSGEAIPLQVRRGELDRERAFRGSEQAAAREHDLERARITAGPKREANEDRQQLVGEYSTAMQRLQERFANGQETEESFARKKAAMDRALALESDALAGRGMYGAVSRDPSQQR